MLFKQLHEAVTMSKLNKIHKQFLSKLTSDSSLKDRIENLNFDDEKQLDEFCNDVFGKPKSIFINTRDEQKLLLKRMSSDYKSEKSNDFMRRVLSGSNETF